MNGPSQQASDPVIVARVIGPHGREGGLNVQLLSNLPGRFAPGLDLFLGPDTYTISAFRQTGPDSAMIWLEGILTRSRASAFTAKFLAAKPESDALLEEGEYFHYQLIGMQVRTEEGEELGELQEILETGSNDVYIIRDGSKELLIPATEQVVLDVDVAGNAMLVRLPDGLR